MKSREGPSPKRKVSHTKWKHRQTQNSVAKHIKAEKLQAKLHFLFGFWQDQELSWEKLERMKVYRAWYLCDQERGCRHRSSTKKARDEQGKAAPMPYLSALLQPAHAALCCSSPGINGQNTITIGSILLPKNPNHTWRKAGTELHFWEHNGFLSSSASLVVSVSQIFHLSLEKQQVPEKALSQVKPKKAFQTNIRSSYTNTSLSHLY